MTALWAALGVGLGAIVTNQVFAVIGVIVWALVVDNLLATSFRTSAASPRRLPATRSPPTSPTTSLRRPPAALLLLGYVAAFVAAGAVLVARRDVT